MQNQMAFVVQLAVGLVFLLSVRGKLMNPLGFARGVIEYRILPDRVSYLAGLLLIPTEILLAATHLTGWLLSFGVLSGIVVLTCFMAGVAINLRRGRLLPCHCFGASKGDVISGRTLARLALLMAGELLLLASADFSSANSPVNLDRFRDVSEFGPAFLSAVFVLVFGNWLLNAADVVKLLRPLPVDGAGASKSASDSTQNAPD
jgi:Methylamine utilisation protein MauE